MTVYEPAPREVEDMCAAVLRDYPEFEPLVKVGLTVELTMASAVEKKDGSKPPALKLRGRACHGITSINKPKQRAHGRPDANITLDADYWETAKENEKKAVLFHELLHFDLVLDDTGAPKEDDYGRPRLTMRQHDFEFGFFVAVAHRFGRDSHECQQFRTMVEQGGEYLMPSVFGKEIVHNADTLTLVRNGQEETIPCDELAKVRIDESHQLPQ